MTLNEYQAKAMRTSTFKDDKDRLFHAIFGLTSEAGECSGILQKTYQGHEFDKEHLVSELGDCLWMIAEALYALDVPLEACADHNIKKLLARYPWGFTPTLSINRKEGDI